MYTRTTILQTRESKQCMLSQNNWSSSNIVINEHLLLLYDHLILVHELKVWMCALLTTLTQKVKQYKPLQQLTAAKYHCENITRALERRECAVMLHNNPLQPNALQAKMEHHACCLLGLGKLHYKAPPKTVAAQHKT